MNALEQTAKTVNLQTINKKWDELRAVASTLAQSKIAAVNITREIGIAFQTACGHYQLSFAAFEKMKPTLPPSLTFEAAKKCVKLANAMPEPATTLEDAGRFEQLCLEGAGVAEEPKRLEPHVSHGVAPTTFFFVAFAELRDKLAKRIAEFNAWDEDTQAAVRTEIERAEKWIVELKEQVQ